LVTSQSLFNSPELYFGGNSNAQAYIDWSTSQNAMRYNASLFLESTADPANGVAVHWKIEDDTLHLAVAAKAKGWVGFGLSENGGMQGADVVLFQANKPDELQDSFILEERLPIADDCQSWTFVNSQTEDGFLIFEASRLLVTGDNRDHPILNDSSETVPLHRVIAAWGDLEEVGFHGDNNARGAIRWFGGGIDASVQFEETMKELSEGFFEVRAVNYTVKAIDTEYADFCFGRSDMLAQGVPAVDKLYIVGFEPIVDPRAVRHVHHFTVYGGSDANDGNPSCENLFQMVYVWTPGDQPFSLPENIGAPLGPSFGIQSFNLEIHYDNPDLVEGVFDSSGVRFYYTTQSPEFEMGVLQLGDPFVNLLGQPVGQGLMQHSFECDGGCSQLFLQKPVMVVRELLHMHQNGVSMYNQQVRDGEVIRSGSVDFFNFAQNGGPAVQQDPFEVKPGDGFKTVCHYRSQDDVAFGLSSQDEMCIAFLFYYPRQLLQDVLPWACGYNLDFFPPQCSSDYDSATLTADSDLDRTFGSASEECPGGGTSGSGMFQIGMVPLSLVVSALVNAF